MVTKVVAGACVVALAAVSGSGAARAISVPARPVVVRISVPLPVGGERGYASFATSLGGTHLRFAAIWSGGEEHRRLALMLTSERDEPAE